MVSSGVLLLYTSKEFGCCFQRFSALRITGKYRYRPPVKQFGIARLWAFQNKAAKGGFYFPGFDVVRII
jgi:hypothetical protein